MPPEPEPRPHAIPALTLGWRLQMSLRQAGVSAQEMADELGVSRGTVSRWMNDHAGTPPRAIFLKQWALRCGVPQEWLLTGVNHETPRPGGEGSVVAVSNECARQDSNLQPSDPKVDDRRLAPLLPFPRREALPAAAELELVA